MALYAAFLVTVGIPLLAMGTDVSRVYLMKVRLRNATEAACQAYANSLDIRKFQFDNQLVFTDGIKNSQYVFTKAMGGDATFGAVEERSSAGKAGIGGGKSVETIVIRCFSTGLVDAVVPFWGNYGISETASAKTKFSTVELITK